MNESFIHHVVRVALILGLVAGLAGFALLLYASDFWSSPSKPQPAESVPAASGAAPQLQVSRNFGERAVIWMFGEPEPEAQPAINEAPPPVSEPQP